MDARRSSIAMRTRAKTKEDFNRRLAEYFERNKREKAHASHARKAEGVKAEVKQKGKSRDSHARNDDEEKGEEVIGNKLNKWRGSMNLGRNVLDDNEGIRNDIEILGEEVNPKGRSHNSHAMNSDKEKGEEVTGIKLSKKRRRSTIKRGQNRRDADEGSGSDIEILKEVNPKGKSHESNAMNAKEEKGELANENKLNKMRGTVKLGDYNEGIGNDIEILGEEVNPKGRSHKSHAMNSNEEKEEKVTGIKLIKKRRGSTIKRGQNRLDADEGSGSDIEILREVNPKGKSPESHAMNDEEEKGGKANGNNLNKRRGMIRTGQNGRDGDRNGSDIEILHEEYVPPNLRFKRGNGRKGLLFGSKRGKGDGNRTNERINDGVSGGGLSRDGTQKKGKDVMIENPDLLKSESSGSEEDNNDSHNNNRKEQKSASSDTQSDDLSKYREEDFDGGENKDNGKASPEGRCFIEEREEYSEDEGSDIKTAVNDERENLVGGNVREEKVGGTEDVLNKRKVHGSSSWVDDEVRKSRLQSLRPQLQSVPQSRKKMLRDGRTKESAIPVSETEDSDSLDEDSNYDDHEPKSSTKSSNKVEKISKRGARMTKLGNFINIHLDSMLQEGDKLKENLRPPKERAPTQNSLPLKFRFEDEDPAPPEKEAWEKEIDNLFAEMEMGLSEPDSDSTESSMAENGDVTATAKTPAERCLLGEHQLVLREPTGIICKCCQVVCVEMKDIFPDLKKPTPGRWDWVDFGRDDHSIFDEFNVGDSAYEDYRVSFHAEGSVLDLIPVDIIMSLYNHQLDGFVFLWKNIGGETRIKKLNTHIPDDGKGCIISHAPGTGKTFLTIVFILSFMKIYPMCRPVIIAPRSMLRTWEDELQKWGFTIPFHNLNSKDLSGKENEIDASILRQLGSGKQSKMFTRMVKLWSWTKHESILGISYNLFEQLTKKERHDGKVRKILLEMPGLLVLDEGHTPRSDNSLKWKILTKVQTRRRIILSGTPFQNNFDELYNTLCLVNPKLSDSITSERRKNNCRKSQRKSNVEKVRWISLTNGIDKKSDDVVEELKALMDPFVHVHKGTILQESLPGLKDTLVILRPTDQQKNLLQQIPDDSNGFDKVHLVSLISVHPSLATSNKEFSANGRRQGELEVDPDAGVKTKFVMELIRICNAWNEKVLVFSEFIHPLTFIMKQLADKYLWKEGKEVLYIDGKSGEKHRQSSINSLNDPTSEGKVLLASTRACSEGINLVGASRVVLLDVVWNPSVERQAISRAYRLGQKKVVYVYHLITSGTLEVDKYAPQAKKDRVSELVFSCRDSQKNKSKISSTVAEDKILKAMLNNKMLNDMFEDIIHQPKESNLIESFNFVEHK